MTAGFTGGESKPGPDRINAPVSGPIRAYTGVVVGVEVSVGVGVLVGVKVIVGVSVGGIGVEVLVAVGGRVGIGVSV